MSLSTYYLEYGSHLAQHHRRRRRRRRRAYAPTSNTASHDNHEKINSWVSFCFPNEYGAPLLKLKHKSTSVLSRMQFSDWLHYSLSILFQFKSTSVLS